MTRASAPAMTRQRVAELTPSVRPHAAGVVDAADGRIGQLVRVRSHIRHPLPVASSLDRPIDDHRSSTKAFGYLTPAEYLASLGIEV